MKSKDRDDTKFNNIMEGATGTTFNYACRAKQDTFNVCTSWSSPFEIVENLFLGYDTRTVRHPAYLTSKLS